MVPPHSAPSRRYFRIADMTIAVESDILLSREAFHPKFRVFETPGPGSDTVVVRHHAFAYSSSPSALGREVGRFPPYVVYDRGDAWVYRIGENAESGSGAVQTALFSRDYALSDIYTPEKEVFERVGLESLTLLPTDQILLAPLLARRGGCLLHAAGVVFHGQGLLFAGPSTAGKSTMMNLLRGRAEILCDDRIAIRPSPSGFKAYGTWSHGDVEDVSAASAPLQTVFFLVKSSENAAVPISARKTLVRRLLDLTIKSFPSAEWWGQTLEVIDALVAAIPGASLRFDRSGGVVDVLKAWLAGHRTENPRGTN